VRARHVLTDRHGVRGAAHTELPGRSTGPWASLNVATHVGDDPDAVAANRVLVAQSAGVDPSRLVVMDQVHGSTVVAVDDVPVEPPSADALVTTAAGLGLVVMVADCVPIVLASDHAVGVVHAGRRGVETGVVAAAVAAMRAQSPGDAGAIRAVIGPAVCGPCYEVPQDLHDAVAAVTPEASARTRTGTPALDLRAAVTAQLHAAGVAGDDIERLDGCTVEDPALYSYRRDGVTGRFAMVAWLS
jgi:YfiH family protein